MTYPECTKLSNLARERRTVIEFLEWLEERGLYACDKHGNTTNKSHEALAHEFLGIDDARLEKERRTILENLQPESADGPFDECKCGRTRSDHEADATHPKRAAFYGCSGFTLERRVTPTRMSAGIRLSDLRIVGYVVGGQSYLSAWSGTTTHFAVTFAGLIEPHNFLSRSAKGEYDSRATLKVLPKGEKPDFELIVLGAYVD